MSDHVRMEEMIAAYALDALDDDATAEASRELLDHMASCERCRATFTQLRETAADLAFAVDPEPVPARMERELISRIRRESAPTTKGRARRLMRVAVAAALASVVAMAGATVYLASQLSDAREQRSLATDALAMLADPRTTVQALRGEQGLVRVMTHPDGEGLLIGDGLRLPEGKLFEIWLVRGADVVPAGTFVPDQGRALVPFTIDPARDIGVAITIEDEPVEQPTGQPVFQGSIRA